MFPFISQQKEEASVASQYSPASALDPSLDDALPVSPSEDLHLYDQQMLGMAKALKMGVAISDMHPKDRILSHCSSDTPQQCGVPNFRRFIWPHHSGLAETSLCYSHPLEN